MTESQTFDPRTQELSGATSIEASAGTGKTYSITLLWLRLLVERGLRVDQILVSTFTQAATAELRERLLASLRRAVSAAQAISEGLEPAASDETRVIAARLEATPGSAAALIRHLTESLSAFDLAPIQTIHGFCQSLIGRHSLELSCDPDLRLQEDCDSLLDEITGDFLMEASETQAPQASALRRLAHTLQSRPAAVVRGVSKNREGLQEERARCLARIAAEAPLAIQHLKLAKSRESVEKLVRNLLEGSSWKELSDSQARNLPPSFTELWSRHRQLELAETRIPATRLAERIREELPRRKAMAGIRTFDDILLTVREALAAQGPEGSLARAVRSRLRAAILDECQDSDTLQIEVFQTLFAHPDTEAFLIIGDPKQSIYRFRGADLASYRSLAKTVRSAPPMTVNHRSDPSLIHAINHLHGEGFRFPDSLAGDAPFEYVPVTAKAPVDRISDPAERRAVVIQWSPEADRKRAVSRLADLAASEIARLLRDPVTIIDRHSGTPRRLEPGDIGVLAASHSDLRRVRRALHARGIPCQSSGKGLGSVFHSDETLDVLGWLELLVSLHHHQDLLGRLSAFLLSPLGAGSPERLLEIQDHPGEQAALFQRFLQARQELGRVGPLLPLLRWISGNEISAPNLGSADGERRLTNWRQVGTLLQQRFESGARSPEALAAWLARQIAEAPESLGEGAGGSTLMRLETDASAVQLNTIHGAKGLEYPVVFCPFLWKVRGRNHRGAPNAAVARVDATWVVDVGSDEFEATLEAAEAQESDEETRRLYVALTRARHRLYLGMAPVTAWPKHTGKNSAADSPLAQLPGLAADSMDTWPARWSGLAAHGIQFLAETSERISIGHGDSVHQPSPDATTGVCPPTEGPGILAGTQLEAPLLQPTEVMASPLPLAANRSFTSLSRSDVEQEPSAADRDLTVVPESPVSTVEATASTDVLATLGAAGSLLGDQLHRALEDHLGNGRAIDQAVAGFDSPDAWRDSLASILDTAIEPVPGLRFRLSDLRGDCITEMQFLLPVDRISAKMLSAVFVDDPRLQSMAGGRDWAEQLTGWSFTEFTGFLQGFIDLVFERDGRWYVADYKSNRLVRYNPAALDRVMLEANYFLQARIYLLALHRHLRAHLPGYDPDRHLGGVAYLFVRGFPAQGVWFDAPSAEALDRFDALFQHPALQP